MVISVPMRQVFWLFYTVCRGHNACPLIWNNCSIRKSKLSAVMQTFFLALYTIANQYLSNPAIFQYWFHYYAELIKKKSNAGDLLQVWGFVDGLLRKTCRPILFQKLMYSGHKRCHGIKFQSVVTPDDGLIALLYGPIPGSRHDFFMLNNSGVLVQLRNLMPDGPQHQIPVYSLYGDPAYPQ